MSEEEVIKKINDIRKEYSTMDGLKEYVEAIDLFLNRVNKQQKEIERLNEIINSRYYHDLKCRELEIEINKNWQDKIKKFIKDELPDDELMECCKIYDVNGIDLRIKLEKLLEE